MANSFSAAAASGDGLLTPLKVGALALNHRVVMAPLNRLLALREDGIPSALTTEHYATRSSSGGLIISESIAISAQGIAQPGTAGIFGANHVNAWRRVTDEVHQHGALIVAQLWHAGRLANPLHTGRPPISASAVACTGVDHEGRPLPAQTPQALDDDGIDDVLDQYRRAAENAADAGFDGVEMSCAYGCLADQFLQDVSNFRTDGYGGSAENRARFLVEVVETLNAVWGNARVGVRLSPFSRTNGMGDSAPESLFAQVLAKLRNQEIAYVHIALPSTDATDSTRSHGDCVLTARHWKTAFAGTLIAAGSFDGDSAQAAIASGSVDAVAFGRSFLENPDLPERLRQGVPLRTQGAFGEVEGREDA